MLFSSQPATTQGACATKRPSPTSFGGFQRCTGLQPEWPAPYAEADKAAFWPVFTR